MTSLLAFLRDMFPAAKPCRYGCNFATPYGPVQDAHERLQHAGDPASMERTA